MRILLKMIDTFGKMYTKIRQVVLGNTTKNATYTSLDIQKRILNIMSNRVWQRIHMEVGDANFSILVNKVQDESSQE